MSPQRNWPSVAETQEETERRMRHLPGHIVAVGEIRQALKTVIEGVPDEKLRETIDPRKLLVAFVGTWASAEAHALRLTKEFGEEFVNRRAQEIFDLFELLIGIFAISEQAKDKLSTH